MTRVHLAPSTVIALAGILAIASCNPCEPCDDDVDQLTTARVSVDLPGVLELGASAGD